MTIRFMLPGKCRESFLVSGYNEYLKRISKFAKVSLVNLTEEPLNSKPSPIEIQKALDKEALRALNQVKNSDVLILLDVHASLPTSEELASEIKKLSERSGNLIFLLGSSYGLSDLLRKRADYSFSLSKMTFTHYLAMLLTLEQVYRSLKINSGETYNK